MMKKHVFSACLLALSLGAMAVNPFAGHYEGVVNVAGEKVAGHIEIYPGSELNKYVLVLPEFGVLGIELGDIVVANIPIDPTSGTIAIENYPFWVEAVSSHVGITITDFDGIDDDDSDIHMPAANSVADGDSISIYLAIDVPDLDPIPVLFNGKRPLLGNYQPLNAGFEEGGEVTVTSTGYEPESWHGFVSVNAVGTFATAANPDQMGESSITRPGSYGHKSVRINSKKILTVVANGNLTTGRINGASMSATDANNNYNYMDPAEPDYVMPFVGRPDSVTVWTKFQPGNAESLGSVSTELLRNERFQTPTEGFDDVVIAEVLEDIPAGDWTRFSAPYTYDESGDRPEMFMMTFTTNKTPGQGTVKDTMYIDDILLKYNSLLTSIQVGDQILSIEGNLSVTDSAFCDSCGFVSALNNSVSAKTYLAFDPISMTLIIIVAGDDYVANTNNYHRYVIGFEGRMPADNGEQPEIIPEDNPEQALDQVIINNTNAQKIMHNGQVLIIRQGHAYDLLGTRIW